MTAPSQADRAPTSPIPLPPAALAPSGPSPSGPSATWLSGRARLLHRIARRWRVIQQTVAFGPLRLPFTRIAQPDRLLDELADSVDRQSRRGQRVRDEDLRMPYWAELWESSVVLSGLLLDLRPEGDALDLGCGMGLCGLVAATLGWRTTLCDRERDALLLARVNTGHLPHAACRRLDWARDHLPQRFKLIIGADIVYEREQWAALLEFVAEHLHPEGLALLGEPGRKTGDDFVGQLHLRRWQVGATWLTDPSGKRIRVLRVRKGP